MADQDKPKTIEELRKVVGNPSLQIKPPIIVHYGKITLHLESDGFSFDGQDFHQAFSVVKELKPPKKTRKPKEPAQAPQAKATGKKS